eukprot:gene18803-biopygen5447
MRRCHPCHSYASIFELLRQARMLQLANVSCLNCRFPLWTCSSHLADTSPGDGADADAAAGYPHRAALCEGGGGRPLPPPNKRRMWRILYHGEHLQRL